MGVNSRNKGSKNERGVAKLMQEWTGYEFARTPQSGGLHWKKQHTSGDIVCIDNKHGHRFPFSIECKFHENFELIHLIDNTKGKSSNKIIHFWEQSLKDALAVKKMPIVFMRKNGMKKDMHFVIMTYELWCEAMKKLPITILEYGGFHFWKEPEELSLMIINSEDLFKMDYQTIYKATRKLNKQNYDKS